jgi:predicted aspartyl protease
MCHEGSEEPKGAITWRPQQMGQVVVSALIENLFDLKAVEEGRISADQVRRIELADARIDTGANFVSMPRQLIEKLGLGQLEVKSARTATGSARFGIFEPVKLTIGGRDCEVRVTEVADSCPVLIGFIPLEMLDFVVDPRGQRLIGNPDHGGEWMIDMYLHKVEA